MSTNIEFDTLLTTTHIDIDKNIEDLIEKTKEWYEIKDFNVNKNVEYDKNYFNINFENHPLFKYIITFPSNIQRSSQNNSKELAVNITKLIELIISNIIKLNSSKFENLKIPFIIATSFFEIQKDYRSDEVGFVIDYNNDYKTIHEYHNWLSNDDDLSFNTNIKIFNLNNEMKNKIKTFLSLLLFSYIYYKNLYQNMEVYDPINFWTEYNYVERQGNIKTFNKEDCWDGTNIKKINKGEQWTRIFNQNDIIFYASNKESPYLIFKPSKENTINITNINKSVVFKPNTNTIYTPTSKEQNTVFTPLNTKTATINTSLNTITNANTVINTTNKGSPPTSIDLLRDYIYDIAPQEENDIINKNIRINIKSNITNKIKNLYLNLIAFEKERTLIIEEARDKIYNRYYQRTLDEMRNKKNYLFKEYKNITDNISSLEKIGNKIKQNHETLDILFNEVFETITIPSNIDDRAFFFASFPSNKTTTCY